VQDSHFPIFGLEAVDQGPDPLQEGSALAEVLTKLLVFGLQSLGGGCQRGDFLGFPLVGGRQVPSLSVIVLLQERVQFCGLVIR
jgi:hypothetical protein